MSYPGITLEVVKMDMEECVEYKYIEKDIHWLYERALAMEKALEAARHSLATLTGLVACDNYDTIPRDVAIRIDEGKTIRKIDRALKPLHRRA